MKELQLNDIADDLLILNKHTIDTLFSLENCVDCIALYIFYYKTAKWQKTNTIKANDEYVKKCLKIGSDKLKKAKDILKEKGLIKVVDVREKGVIAGWYIQVSYLVKQEKIDSIAISHNSQNPQVVEPTSGNQEVNALIYNNKCLNNNKEMLKNNIIKDNKKFLKEKEIIEPQEERVCCSNNKGYVAGTTKGMSLEQQKEAEPMALTTEVVEPKNEIAKQDDINFDEILNHWNSLDIIHHKKITLKTQKKIRDLIKNDGFTIQDILIFMDRYNVTLKDEHYFFKYKWSLEEFITREKGVKEFKDNGGKWLNYLNSPSGKKFEEQETFSNLDMSDWLGGNRNVR